jgi:hypothetical protein
VCDTGIVDEQINLLTPKSTGKRINGRVGRHVKFKNTMRQLLELPRSESRLLRQNRLLQTPFGVDVPLPVLAILAHELAVLHY